MLSLRTYGRINATPSQKRFVIWVQDTVRFCVTGTDGWVHYLLQKDAAGGVGQGARLVETAMNDKIVVADEEY